MTDKELKKLTRLELLELLLEQSKENERLSSMLEGRDVPVVYATGNTASDEKIDKAVEKIEIAVSAISQIAKDLQMGRPAAAPGGYTYPANSVATPVAYNAQTDSQLLWRLLQFFYHNEELLLYLPQDISMDIRARLRSVQGNGR